MIAVLEKIGGENTVLAHGKEKSRFTHIWKTDLPLEALAVVFPKTTQDLSAILQLCHQEKQEVVVHGGLTNLVGATQTEKKQLVIALTR